MPFKRDYFILLSKRFYSRLKLQAVFDGWNFILESLFRVDKLREYCWRREYCFKDYCYLPEQEASWRRQQSQRYLFHNPWTPSPGSNHHLPVQLVPKQSFAQPTTLIRPWIEHSLQLFQKKLTMTISAPGKMLIQIQKICFNWIHFWGAFKLSRDFSGLSIPPSPKPRKQPLRKCSTNS